MQTCLPMVIAVFHGSAHNFTSWSFYTCTLLKQTKNIKKTHSTGLPQIFSNLLVVMEENWCSRFWWLRNVWLNKNFGYLSFIACMQNSSISFAQYYFVLKHFGQCKKKKSSNTHAFIFGVVEAFLSLEVINIWLLPNLCNISKVYFTFTASSKVVPYCTAMSY